MRIKVLSFLYLDNVHLRFWKQTVTFQKNAISNSYVLSETQQKRYIGIILIR